MKPMLEREKAHWTLWMEWMKRQELANVRAFGLTLVTCKCLAFLVGE